MKTSIVMSTYKRPYLLNLGLFSLSLQKTNHELEVIVVNDGLPDGSEEICKNYSSTLNIKYYFSGQRNLIKDTRRCPCVANNIGVKQSSGEIIILTCPEILHLTPNNVDNLIDPFTDYRLENKFLAKPKGIYFDLKDQVKYDEFSEYCSKLPFFLGMRKEHFMDIGGYDEDLIGYACDDDDLVERLQSYGCQYITCEGSVLHLNHGGSFVPVEQLKENPDYLYNLKIYQERKGIIKRNQNREWGVL